MNVEACHSGPPPADGPAAPYNAAADLVGRNLAAGRAAQCAYIDDHGRYTYADLDRAVRRMAACLRGLGIQPEQRILLCLHDSFALPVLFLGAIRAGIVPVLANTLLTPADYTYLLADSRARHVFVSPALADILADARGALAPAPSLHVVAGGQAALETLLTAADGDDGVAATSSDEACFWLYSSGSTGRPKGTVHVHASLARTAALYAAPVLALTPDDVVFSAATLFFAYGLGNALSFPCRRRHDRPDGRAPDTRGGVRAARAAPRDGAHGVRPLCEPAASLPAAPARLARAGAPRPAKAAGRDRPALQAHFVSTSDGIGSTEMLHIFLSTASMTCATAHGKPVPAMPCHRRRGRPRRRTGRHRRTAGRRPHRRRHVLERSPALARDLRGPWTRTGDKYRQTTTATVYCGAATTCCRRRHLRLTDQSRRAGEPPGRARAAVAAVDAAA